ncbi:hypothetical protein HDC35_003887 [Sphingopyxis sp. JAI128]|nr:hypothetical protein [Sphingopyxis sp. JAI128]
MASPVTIAAVFEQANGHHHTTKPPVTACAFEEDAT